MAIATDSAPRPRLRAREGALALAVALWLAAGGAGAVRYVHRYWLYRGFPPPVTPAGIARGRVLHPRFFSTALGRPERYWIYLPPGYGTGHRYPVLYLLHPPPGRADGFLEAGAAGVDENVLLARHRLRPMLMVIPVAKTSRFRDDTEWADAAAGRYEDFVLDVVRDVDRRFATLPDRRHRALAGLSEGGYGALNVGLHHLDVFGNLQSWSGYAVQTPTGPFKAAAPAALAANSPADYVGALAPRIRRLGLHVYLYQGTHDDVHVAATRHFAGQLAAAGAKVRCSVYPGGHDWALWRGQMRHMLRVASAWFGGRRAPLSHL